MPASTCCGPSSAWWLHTEDVNPTATPHPAVMIAICCQDMYNLSALPVVVHEIEVGRNPFVSPSLRDAHVSQLHKEMCFCSLVKAILPIETLQGKRQYVCQILADQQAAHVTALSLGMHM